MIDPSDILFKCAMICRKDYDTTNAVGESSVRGVTRSLALLSRSCATAEQRRGRIFTIHMPPLPLCLKVKKKPNLEKPLLCYSALLLHQIVCLHLQFVFRIYLKRYRDYPTSTLVGVFVFFSSGTLIFFRDKYSQSLIISMQWV